MNLNEPSKQSQTHVACALMSNAPNALHFQKITLETERSNLIHHLFTRHTICLTEIISTRRDTNGERERCKCQLLHSCHCTADDTNYLYAYPQPESGSYVFKPLCLFIISQPCAQRDIRICMQGTQAAILSDILIWVEPCMTTDLYIGNLTRRAVAMEQRMQRGWRLANESSRFRTKKIREILELFFKKAGNSL